MFHLSASSLSHCQATSPALLKVFRQSVELLCSVEQKFYHLIICPLLTVSSPTAETLPGNLSQGLSRSCMSAISIVMPPSVCMNKAETALRMKGSGASFCVLPVDPTEPIGTAPLSYPAVRNGSARSVRLLLKPQTTHLKTQVTSPVATALSTPGGIFAETPAWKRIRALLRLTDQALPH